MKRFSALLLGVVLHAGLAAADSPFQFSTVGFRAPDDPHVSGLRFSVVHGDSARIRGVDFGLLSLSAAEDMSGIAFIGGVHKLRGDMDGGVSFSVVNQHEGHDRGANLGFVNLLGDPDRALNVSFLNFAVGSTLVDLGGINASESSAAQIGFLNLTSRLRGFQFGFLNLAENGFLPVFPVFNFPVSRGSDG